MNRTIYVLALYLFGIIAQSQQVKIYNLDKPDISFRGLSVVDDYVFWVSGTKGSIGYSLNGGKTMNWVNPKGYENRDFRAIEALNHHTAIAVAIDSPGIILKTIDNGKTWTEVYRDENPDVFLDAISFPKNSLIDGFVIGDPIKQQAYVLKTNDSGNTWEKIKSEELIALKSGEAFFAASNSNIFALDSTSFLSVSGGSTSRLMLESKPQKFIDLPKTNSQTAGANGLDYDGLNDFGLIVGGDFEKPASSDHNLYIFELKNQNPIKISTPQTSPIGYKSGVSILDKSKAISCGISGVDLSKDKGQNWTQITNTAYHACKKAKMGKAVYLVGPNGRIGKLIP